MTEQERYEGTTPFHEIYTVFETLVTEDMYLEWTKEETHADMRNILMAAIPKFQFPRFKLYDYTLINESEEEEGINGQFNFILTHEEIVIFGNLMVVEWFTRQLATADLTRQKYGSKDFEFTSQANHISRLSIVRTVFESEVKSAQRLYKRRVTDSNGYIKSNYKGLGGKNAN